MKKQIPNILTLILLIMIPVFIVIYFKYPGTPANYVTAGIYFAAWLTDVLDGYLARKYNWITDVGKIIDPLADKLMQLSVAVCFTVENPVFLALLIPMAVKELGMLVGAFIIVKKQRRVEQARWFGKAATVFLFVCTFARIVYRGFNFDYAVLDTVIAFLMLAAILFAAAMYYFKVFRTKPESKSN